MPNIDELKQVYWHGYHKTDWDGRPFYIDNTGSIDVEAVQAGFTEE